MQFSTITRKGQVTIPKTVRMTLGIKPGDQIEFLVKENGEVIVRPISGRVDDVFGMLFRPERKPVSTEEMDAAVAKRFREDAKNESG